MRHTQIALVVIVALTMAGCKCSRAVDLESRASAIVSQLIVDRAVAKVVVGQLCEYQLEECKDAKEVLLGIDESLKYARIVLAAATGVVCVACNDESGSGDGSGNEVDSCNRLVEELRGSTMTLDEIEAAVVLFEDSQ